MTWFKVPQGPTRRKTLRKRLLLPIDSDVSNFILEAKSQDEVENLLTIFNIVEVVPVAHIPGYVACKSVKPLMAQLAPWPCPSLSLTGRRRGGIQSAYLCHIYSALALNLELFYESVNALVNCRFLLLQGTTIKRRSKHLADYSVRLWIWISGNPSVLSLDTLDLLSFDEG